MTDVVKARESAISAETALERVFAGVLDKLHEHNAALISLHDKIKQVQPVASGSVCLELYRCGPGCTGCPHPRWVQYRWTAGTDTKPGHLLSINLDAKGRDPVLALARGTPHYAQTAELVREAKSILSARTTLLARVRALRSAAGL